MESTHYELIDTKNTSIPTKVFKTIKEVQEYINANLTQSNLSHIKIIFCKCIYHVKNIPMKEKVKETVAHLFHFNEFNYEKYRKTQEEQENHKISLATIKTIMYNQLQIDNKYFTNFTLSYDTQEPFTIEDYLNHTPPKEYTGFYRLGNDYTENNSRNVANKIVAISKKDDVLWWGVFANYDISATFTYSV